MTADSAKYTKTTGGRMRTATVTSVPEAGRVAVELRPSNGAPAQGIASADPAADARRIGADLIADGWAEA
jgi:hypothetical protein